VPASGPTAALSAVDAAVDAVGYDLVLPCGDDWVALLDDPDQPRWWSPYPATGAARRCLDKLEVARAAEVVGLATPRTVLADATALATWQGPAVVKTRSHWLPDQTAPHRLEAQRVALAAAARPFVVEAAAAGGAAVLQEPVTGRLGAVTGLVIDGEFVLASQQLADLTWPQPMGITAHARTVEPEPDLVARCGALAAELGYEGLLQVQFLHPVGGAVPHVIDCNPRCYGSLGLAESAGLSLVAAWADWAVEGTSPAPATARAGVRYLWTEGAVRAVAARSNAGHAGQTTSLPSLLKELPRAVHPRWAARDPLPALLVWASLLGRLLRRGLGSPS
jgi:predicted ATP-grasp superfamily ATP-dependent carboligase